IHTAGGTGHHDELPCRAIEHDTQIELARHLKAFFPQYAGYRAARRTRLMGDERHAEHVFGDLFGFVYVLGDLDATAFAAPAGVNLRLHDDESAQTTSYHPAIWRRDRNFTPRHRPAVASQDRLGLVLVNFHDDKTVDGNRHMLQSSMVRDACFSGTSLL